MIRKATPNDLDALHALAMEAVSIDAYEELVVSPEKIRNLLVEGISSPSHFLWVAERGGKVVGALGALVFPMMLYERSHAVIAFWYSRVRGDGWKLMSRFLAWVKSRPIIKEVQYNGERKGDPRILNILQRRYGFRADVPFLYWMR